MTVEPLPLPDWPDYCWPIDTSCVPDWDDWETTPDPEAEPPIEGVPVYTDEQKAMARSLAAQALRMLTGFRVGGCPVAVRPCKAGCSDPTWRTYPLAGAGATSAGPWFPVQLGGTWLNIGCGCSSSCSCSGVDAILLQDARRIEAVLIDGVVLDPTSYRLEAGGLLVRTDGGRWPLCQNMDAPITEPNTWEVRYLAAEPVDRHGALAAGLLAGEFVKLCAGRACALPPTVTQIQRQGVTLTLSQEPFPNGRTGIQLVDLFVQRWNPHGHRNKPRVWSPDVAPSRVVGPGR